ncbi:MAG: flavin reductase [Pseudomonadota bacterium]
MTYSAQAQTLEQGDTLDDPRAFRRCLAQFSTGVNVITTQSDGKPVGVTANSFSSLSMDPPLVLWSIGRGSRSFSAFTTAKHFTVNILSSEQVDVAQGFSSRAEDKFAGIDWHPGSLGSPVVSGVIAVLECETETIHDGGDHVILIGRVKRYARFPGNALLYAQGRYAVAEDHPNLLIQSAPGSNGTHDREASSPVEQMRFTTLLSFVGMYILSAFDEFRQAESLDLPQGRILFVLREGNALTLDEIMSQSYLTRPSVEDGLTSLIERKCVTSRDGVFSLTASGQDIFATLKTQFARFDAEELAGIPKQNLKIARGVLQTLHARLLPSR